MVYGVYKLDQIWVVFQKSGQFWILDQEAKIKKRLSHKVTQIYEEKLNRHTNMSRQFYPLIVRRFCFIQILGLGSTGHPPSGHPRVLKNPSPQRVKG